MATYETVTWQSGDEVTSTKLEQMSKNTEWVKENLILGDAIRVGDGSGLVPSPFTIGSSKIKRIDVKVKPFNSVTPTAWMDIDVNIPNGYTNIPMVIPTVTDVHGRGYYINPRRYNGLHSVTFRITQGDHIAKVLSGQVQVLFIGF